MYNEIIIIANPLKILNMEFASKYIIWNRNGTNFFILDTIWHTNKLKKYSCM